VTRVCHPTEIDPELPFVTVGFLEANREFRVRCLVWWHRLCRRLLVGGVEYIEYCEFRFQGAAIVKIKSVLIFAALTVWGSPIVQAEQASDLAGAWQLVSVETVRPSGEVISPYYGKHPQGLIVYDPSGWMSVQIVSDPKPTVPKDDTREGFRGSPLAERAAAADGYYAYFGTYSVDAAASTVTHHIKQSLYPGERGEESVRHFDIVNDQLILIAKAHEMGEDHQRRLTWQRVPSGKATQPAVSRLSDPMVELKVP
jgi:Lipocalin-like domain